MAILSLTLVLAAVTYGQILLATFAPVAFMAISFEPARKMVSKWATTAVSLMLIKPIVAGIIALNLRLILCSVYRIR